VTRAPQAMIGRTLLIVWVCLQARHSKLVRQHIEAQRRAIWLDYLLAYAPRLKTVCAPCNDARPWCVFPGNAQICSALVKHLHKPQ